MKGFCCLIFGKLGLVLPAFLLTLGLGGCFVSCSKEEPLGHIPNHEANGGSGGNSNSGQNSGTNGENGGSSNAGENGENGGSSNGGGNGEIIDGEGQIVGDWLRRDGEVRISFGVDGWFGSYSAVGYDGGWQLCEEGHYVYKDLSRRVWIETFVDGESRSAVYRTVFGDDDTLTLWSEDNRRLDYKKI